MMMMKFAINHEYKFQYFKLAFMSGFMSVTSTILVEMSSVGLICTATDTIDIVMNFIALVVVIDFDMYVLHSIKNESFKQLMEDSFVSKVTRFKHTTSERCGKDELSEERCIVPESCMIPEGDPEKLVEVNRLLRVQYKYRTDDN